MGGGVAMVALLKKSWFHWYSSKREFGLIGRFLLIGGGEASAVDCFFTVKTPQELHVEMKLVS